MPNLPKIKFAMEGGQGEKIHKTAMSLMSFLPLDPWTFRASGNFGLCCFVLPTPQLAQNYGRSVSTPFIAFLPPGFAVS